MENKIVTMASEKFGTVRKIYEGGKVIFCGADVTKALGYANTRDALTRHCRGVVKRDTPTNSGKQQMSFITEADVYRLICHSKLPSALEFEKWVFEDVVPKAVDKNLNTESEQLTLETSEYHYFKKTLNGEPVITLIDFEFFTGVTTDIVRYKLYHDGKEGKDYFLLQKRELAAFKAENPNITKSLSALVVITKTGVKNLIKHYNCKKDIPLMIGQEKQAPVAIENKQQETGGILWVNEKLKKQLAEIREEAEAIKNLTYLLDAPKGVCITKNYKDMYANTLKTRMRGFANMALTLDIELMLASTRASQK